MTNVKSVYAGGFARAAAITIDTIIIGCVCFLMLKLISNINVQLYNIIGQLACAAYAVFLETSSWQATLGQRVMRIYVGTKDDQRMSYSRAALRYFTWVFLGLPIIYLSTSSQCADMMNQVKNIHDRNLMIQFMQQPEIHRLIIQVLFSYVLYNVLGLLLYFVPIFFTKEKTGVHDLLSGTRVYKKIK